MLLPVRRGRVRVPPSVCAQTARLVLGLAIGGRQAPVVGRLVPRLLLVDNIARALRQKAEELVAGEVIRRSRSPSRSPREETARS